MGVLNVTPDSFSDGGDFFSVPQALEQARKMVEEGAAIIDVGGESTRPGATPVSLQQELDRVIPVIEGIQKELPVPISIDTSKPEVMSAAVASGVGMINDVNALRADGALQVAADTNVPVCLMHMQGEPRMMQENPEYGDVVAEVGAFLAQRAEECQSAGISREHILLDPGFGFGKTLEHNLALLKHLGRLVSLGYPVLVGLSRKSMIGAALGLGIDERLYASLALATLAVREGALLVRAHDVRATAQAVRMCDNVMLTGRS